MSSLWTWGNYLLLTFLYISKFCLFFFFAISKVECLNRHPFAKITLSNSEKVNTILSGLLNLHKVQNQILTIYRSFHQSFHGDHKYSNWNLRQKIISIQVRRTLCKFSSPLNMVLTFSELLKVIFANGWRFKHSTFEIAKKKKKKKIFLYKRK
jgi:hypothetical protein